MKHSEINSTIGNLTGRQHRFEPDLPMPKKLTLNHLYTLPFLFLLICGFMQAEESKEPQSIPKKTICLNMIVRDESEVIERCLTSVLPIIDYWVIVDTGSIDETKTKITEFMKAKGIPGELHEKPWINFAHNRNEALKLAKGKSDYVFFIDADEYLVYDSDFKLPDLDKDYYYVTIVHPGSRHGKVQLINSHQDWEYIGVLHEVIAPPYTRSWANLEKVINMYTTEGARSKDPNKYKKDAKILEDALIDEPNNTRYVFYLAQSYNCDGNHAEALKNYEKYIRMGGVGEEAFWAYLQIGILQEALHMDSKTIIASYMQAFDNRRSRVEPLYRLAHYLREQKNFKSAYEIAKIGMTITAPNDLLFVQQWMYDWGTALEFSISAYWTDKFEECQQTSLDLLKQEELPQHVRECVQNNLGFANAKLIEKICNDLTKDNSVKDVTMSGD